MPAARRTDRFWTNSSVKLLAQRGDPVQTIIDRARSLVLEARESGWTGPPFDATQLASLRGIAVIPRQDIRDARLVPSSRDRLTIEFNPERPSARIRYSIAHELAHTLFPDHAEQVRNRLHASEMRDDEWQLEMLCNLAAAEFLMPLGSFPELGDETPTIDRLMRLRREYEVSAEAVLLRAMRLTAYPCAMFAAARSARSGRYHVDYSFPSRSLSATIPQGLMLPEHTVLAECTAIGFTAKGDEPWTDAGPVLHVECVGIPPYPGQTLPRVVGIVHSSDLSGKVVPAIAYLDGDALSPRGAGPRIIAHVMNDISPIWGGGFALEIRKKWPAAQADFRQWVAEDASRQRVGETRLFEVEKDIFVFTMIAQHGLRRSTTPGIRYRALSQCLETLAQTALRLGATVHMPRVGAGQAGGLWPVVSELVEDALVIPGIRTTVYTPPGASRESQKSLFQRA